MTKRCFSLFEITLLPAGWSSQFVQGLLCGAAGILRDRQVTRRWVTWNLLSYNGVEPVRSRSCRWQSGDRRRHYSRNRLRAGGHVVSARGAIAQNSVVFVPSPSQSSTLFPFRTASKLRLVSLTRTLVSLSLR